MAYQKDVGPAQGILSALSITALIMLFGALCFEGYQKIKAYPESAADCPEQGQDCDGDRR